jgi:hypothetical protein
MWKALLVAGSVLTMTSVIAQPSQAQGAQVMIQGCVKQGVEGGCLIITDRASGKTYQINAAIPKPDPARGLVIRLRGTVVNKIDFCQQGPILEDIKWNYTKMRCPRAGYKQR